MTEMGGLGSCAEIEGEVREGYFGPQNVLTIEF